MTERFEGRTLAWLVAGLLILAVMLFLREWRFPLHVLVAWELVYLGVGVYLVSRLAGQDRSIRARRLHVAAIIVPALLTFSVLHSFVVLTAGRPLFQRARFALLHRHYDAIVRDAQGLPQSGSGTRGLIRYYVDRGPPLRVAFPHGFGFLDNWNATIYDPTDTLASVTSDTWDMSESAPPDIRAIFGGEIVGCRRLAAHYYRCHFT